MTRAAPSTRGGKQRSLLTAAFTLVGLGVAIAIITILAALLWPALLRTRDKPGRVGCLDLSPCVEPSQQSRLATFAR